MEVEVTDNFHFCKICGLPILSAPSYTCTFAACEFFLHESCARKISNGYCHPSHTHIDDNPTHIFWLQEGSPSFTYKCEDCDFEMHPLATAAMLGVEIKSKHKSHPPHPLVALRRRIWSLCDGCGEIHEGFFFSCQICDYWIHQACTVLPTVLTLPSRPMPLLLIYSVPSYYRSKQCMVCHRYLLDTSTAIYFCPQTLSFTHVRCGLMNTQSRTRLELIQLPDDELDTFPSLEIRTYSQRNKDDSICDAYKKLAMENFHKHDLILVDDEEEDHIYNYNHKLVCDICIQTITIPSPFYRCSLQTGGCSFLAHKVCSELVPIIKFALPDPFNVCVPGPDTSTWFFNSIFYCMFCCLPCNGPCYYFPLARDHDDDIPFTVDVSCMAAPFFTKHTSNSQHLLFRTNRIPRTSPTSCCSRGCMLFDVYKCTICDFYIHIRCALLQKRACFRKFDQHPLHLITTGNSSIGSDHDICEVCEEGIECKYWFYHCAKCDYSFHVNCIPPLGYLSKVKFGGKYSMSCHSHPLTFKRMLTYGRNEKCGHCNNIIPGLVDQVAFCCSQCDYWIHFSCARDSLSSSHTPTSLVFGEIDEQPLFKAIKLMMSDLDSSP